LWPDRGRALALVFSEDGILAFSDILLKETVETWRECSGDRLTWLEAEQICETMLGLFEILDRIDKRTRNAQEARETASRD
jgi:hypothetical protein